MSKKKGGRGARKLSTSSPDYTICLGKILYDTNVTSQFFLSRNENNYYILYCLGTSTANSIQYQKIEREKFE